MDMKIKSGIYLVIDPSLAEEKLFPKLKAALSAGLSAVQVWDNFQTDEDIAKLPQLVALCKTFQVPVLINNRVDLLHAYPFDGIHFDALPADYSTRKAEWEGSYILGLTCNNDLDQVREAQENGLDYISFCSVFPSSTANSCELVSRQTLEEAPKIFAGPIFLAGGINPANIPVLKGLDFAGVAVVSGIMGADNPASAIEHYQSALNKIQHEN
jgi:thiamine-phosphate pyrophosphorylase